MSRTGLHADTTVKGTIVWRAHEAKSYTFSGNHFGRNIISGGSAGSRSQGQRPNSANQTRVNTRVRSKPPMSRIHSRARRMCTASGGSPARRSAAYASTVGGQVARTAP